MDILLDTHILLWHLADNPKLSKEKSAMIENPENRKFFSVASLWEIAIKSSIGKLAITQSIENLIPEQIIWLGIRMDHIKKVQMLPFHHKDPFDRMLIAQAMSENLQLMSDDENFPMYEVALI